MMKGEKMAKTALHFLFVAVLLTPAAEAHNITAILSDFPEYSEYNRYLTETKVADEINSRETITCLVVPNPAMAALTRNITLAAVKNALSLLTLLDYFDAAKLHALPSGTALTTTLLQTTGNQPGNAGFLNISDLRGGRVAFHSAVPGSKSESDFTKSVKQIPYNISVLEISAPIVFPGLLDVPSTVSNLTALLESAGCKTFAGLLAYSGVLKMYESAMGRGLTVFAPSDEAFKAAGVPNVKTLTSADLVTLLEYHALDSYTPKGSLRSAAAGGGIRTMASTGSGRYSVSVAASGDDVTILTGVDSSRVASTALDAPPVCVLTVDHVLLPVELFGKAPAPAPGPAPIGAPTPSAPALAPGPTAARAPAPVADSPPAPPMGAPAGSPADAPDDDDVKDDKAGDFAVRPLGAGVAVCWMMLAAVL